MNLLFSAFLIIGYIVCAYFLLGLIKDSFQDNAAAQGICKGLLFALFGLILFYATRVGDGKQVWRFSAASLILVVIPSLYILLTPVITALPLSAQIASRGELVFLAGVAFGYGIPYTFLSGYELDTTGGDTSDSEGEELSEEASLPAEDAMEQTEDPETADNETEENAEY